MSTISTCPRCSRMVAIPEGLDSTTLVRCPLCGAEYPLDAAMDLVPPELIPLETFDETILSGPAQPANKADQGEADIIRLESAAARAISIQTSKKPPPVEAMPKPVAGLVTEPFFTADVKPAGEVGMPPEAAEEASNIVPPPLVSSVILRYGTTLKGQQSSHPNFISEETAETTESPLDDEVFSLIAKHKEEIKKESPGLTEPLALHNRSQRKPKSVVRIFVEIAFGGPFGICIGYFVLCWIIWIMGARFDIPRPPKVLKPVLQFVLPDGVWQEKEQPRKN